MARVRDYLRPEVSARFADEHMTRRGRAILNIEVPPGYPAERVAAITALLEEQLPKLSLGAVEAQRLYEKATAPAMLPAHDAGVAAVERGFRRLPLGARLLAQAGSGMNWALPSWREEPLVEMPGIPEPMGFGERLARTAGGVAGFSVTAAPVAAFGATAGAPAAAVAALSAGAGGAVAPGTVKQRAVRGAVSAGAGAGAALAGKVAGQLVLTSGRARAQAFARAAAERGGPEGVAMLRAWAARASATARGASRATEAVTGAVTFGGIAPFAEHAALNALGEETEAPKVEDVLSGMAELGIITTILSAGRGGGGAGPRRSRPGGPGQTMRRADIEVMRQERTQPPRRGEPPAEGGAPRVPPIGPQGPAEPAGGAPTRMAVPDAVAGAVFGIAKGNGTNGPRGRLSETNRNPLDRNLTPMESYRARVIEIVGSKKNPADSDWIEAARNARRQVLGVWDLYEKLAPPPGATPALQKVSEAASQRWSDYLGGKGITLRVNDRTTASGRVVGVWIYPWGAEQFRVALQDEATGQIVARSYPDAAAFNAAVVSMGRPPQAVAAKPKAAGKPGTAPAPEPVSPQAKLKLKPGTAVTAETQTPREAETEPRARGGEAPIEEPAAPARQSAAELPAFEDFALQPKGEMVRPKSFSEEDLNAASLKNRQRMTEPAEWKRAPVGTLAKDKHGDLWELVELPVEDRRLNITESPGRQTVEKYAEWARAGHEIPPIKTVETEKGSLNILDGTHRIFAARAAGQTTIKAWVSRAVVEGTKVRAMRETDVRVPFPQQTLDVGPREIPTTPIGPKPTRSAADAVAAMGGEAKTFAGHFADLVKKGTPPDEARAEAEKLAGNPPPPGFDAEARAKAIIAREAEARGQASLFGAPEPAPATKKQTVKEAPTGPGTERTVAGPTGAPNAGESAKPMGTVKFRQKMFRGAGRTGEEPPIYGEFASGPIFGEGRYYAKTALEAMSYGPEVFENTVELRNPLVLRTDADFKAFFGRSSVNPITDAMSIAASEGLKGNALKERAKALVAERVAEMRAKIEAAGHDGVVIEMDPQSDAAKRMREVFEHDQVFVLPEPQASPAASPGPQVAGTKMVPGTRRAQSLHFHEPFQQRDTDLGLVDRDHIQNMLEKKGGFDLNELVADPITVWTDTEGRIGPAGRTYVLSGHHRAYLAQHDWARLEGGRWSEAGLSDRDVPTVEFKGTYDEAFEYAETSNLRGKTNTAVEKAGVARRLADKGMPIKDVAARVTGGKVAQAQDLINLSYLDGQLQRQFFGEKGLPLNVGSYLGDFTRRYNVHPEHQRTWLSKLKDGQIRSADELKDVVEGYLKVLKAANQTSVLSQMDMGPNAISPKLAHDYLGRAMRLVGQERRMADRAAKDLRRRAKQGLNATESEAARILLDRHRKDYARAVRIEAEVQSRALKAVREASEQGKSLADAMYAVKEWVDAQLRFSPDESGSTTFFSDGPASRWLTQAIRRGARRAFARSIETSPTPRPASADLRPVFDDYSDFATLRMFARLRMGQWQDVLVPQLQDEYRRSGAAEMFLSRKVDDAWQAALGSDAAIRYFAEGGTGARQLALALEGRPADIPAEFRDVPKRVRAFLDQLYDDLVAHAERTGQEPPKYRKGYLPHVILGERSKPLLDLLEQVDLRPPSEMAQAEITERHNRFFERREGHPGYVKDAAFAIKQYAHEYVKKLAWDDFLIATRDWLARPESATSDIDRANLTRDWARARFFRKPSGLETRMDDIARRVLFQSVTRGMREIGLERAARALKTSEEKLQLAGAETVTWVPPGVEIRPGQGVELGSWAGGRLVGHAKGEVILPKSTPIARRWVRAAMSIANGRATLRPNDSEAAVRHAWKVERGLDDLERSPSAAIMGAVTGRITTNIFWWNVPAAAINMTGTLVTTLPEYGARAYMAGVGGATKGITRAAVRKGLRLYIAAAEKSGWLPKQDAEVARRSMPLLIEEVYAEATGTLQHEALRMEQRGLDIAEGKNPDVRAVLRSLVTRGDWMFAFAEGMNRSVSIMAADHFSRREFGDLRRVPETFATMQDARERFLAKLGAGGPESYATRATLLDQFAYDPGSFPMAGTGPFGRTVFQLMRWPLAALKRYGLRTTEGASRVGMALARGVTDLATGRRAGPSAAGISQSRLPRPSGWFEEFLEYHGANWQHRHAAAVFIRQFAISSLLLAGTVRLGVALTNIGTPPAVMLTLWLLRQFFQDDQEIADWYAQASEGAMVSTTRLPVGPVAAGAVQAGETIGQAFDPRGPIAPSQFPWESILGTVRLYLVRGEPAIKRLVQENPRWFEDHAPWVFKAFGITRVYPGMTPAEVSRHQTRMMTRKERQEVGVAAQP